MKTITLYQHDFDTIKKVILSDGANFKTAQLRFNNGFKLSVDIIEIGSIENLIAMHFKDGNVIREIGFSGQAQNVNFRGK